MVESVEMDPFKALLAGVIPQNDVGGAKPVINTVFDETTREYGEITSTSQTARNDRGGLKFSGGLSLLL